MAAKAASALLFLVLLSTPAAQAAALAGGEEHSGLPTHVTPISKEAFDEMLASSVEEKGGIETEEGDTLRVELRDEARVLFFTRPGHRAHPGIVEVRIVEEEGGPGIDTSGWWAGDAQAFETWFRVFQRRNERLSRQWREE